MNENVNKALMIFQQTIFELLDFKKVNDKLTYQTNFNAEIVKNIILTKLDRKCISPSSNIVILELRASSNSNEEILRIAEMYKKDFILEDNSFLDIIADEAIF